MMNLREVVERYARLAGSFGNPVALSAFALSERETENLFSALDEDYQISRFLYFSRADGQAYTVSGEAATHISIDPSIYTLL
jgi:hypothetical protein